MNGKYYSYLPKLQSFVPTLIYVCNMCTDVTVCYFNSHWQRMLKELHLNQKMVQRLDVQLRLICHPTVGAVVEFLHSDKHPWHTSNNIRLVVPLARLTL